MTGGHPIFWGHVCVSPCRKKTESDKNVHLQYEVSLNINVKLITVVRILTKVCKKVRISHYLAIYKYLAMVEQHNIIHSKNIYLFSNRIVVNATGNFFYIYCGTNFESVLLCLYILYTVFFFLTSGLCWKRQLHLIELLI